MQTDKTFCPLGKLERTNLNLTADAEKTLENMIEKMVEKKVVSDYGNVIFWVSEDWNIEKNTMFFFPGLAADHNIFQDQIQGQSALSPVCQCRSSRLRMPSPGGFRAVR